MSNIDKQALREAAELFVSEGGEPWWDEKQLTHEDGLGLSETDGKFIAAAKPAAVLALLDELEAMTTTAQLSLERVVELETALEKEKGYASAYEGEKWHYHNLAESEGERANLAESKLNAAEKRIAELEQQLIKPLPIGELLQRLENQTGEPWGDRYLAFSGLQQDPIVVPDDQHAVAYHDNRSRVFVLEQRGNRRQFTYEEWKVICMAANCDMENRLHTLGHAMALRQQRWEDERERLQHRIDELEKANG